MNYSDHSLLYFPPFDDELILYLLCNCNQLSQSNQHHNETLPLSAIDKKERQHIGEDNLTLYFTTLSLSSYMMTGFPPFVTTATKYQRW